MSDVPEPPDANQVPDLPESDVAEQPPELPQEALEGAPQEPEPAVPQGFMAKLLAGKSGPWVTLAKDSPFLMISLGVHIAILILFAFITAVQPQAPKQAIAIQMEELKTDEVKMQPLQREENLASLSDGSSMLVGAGAQGESLQTATKQTVKMQVPRVNILGLRAPTGAGNGGDFTGNEGEGCGALVPGTGGTGVGGAVDEFAVITLNCMMQGKTMVVLIIDQSPSVLYGDLPRIIERMDHYFDEISKNLPRQMEGRGQWVVMQFGKTATFACKPSTDLEYIKNALRSVESDRSGVENTGLAVGKALEDYGKAGQKYLLIAVMTDEAGDDIENPALLEHLIERMRQLKAQFFVFGYEASFCTRLKEVSVPAAAFRGRDLAEFKAFADASKKKLEEISVRGWAEGGPECPRPELWWTENWSNWQTWGGSFNNIPSGFGMYALNRMALATGGIYFLLRPESKYDEEKLYARYKPDICSVLQYKKRMQEVDLRRTLEATWVQIGQFHLGNDLRDAEQVQQAMAKAIAGRTFCISRAEQLKSLSQNSKPVGDNWGRWLAHADVTVAELLRFRFMLGQYHEVLRAQWQKAKGQMPEGKRLVFSQGRAPDDFVGADAAKKEYDEAAQYIELVTDKHKGTPWEIMGQRLRQGLHPWKCDMVDVPKPQPPPATPPPVQPSMGL